MFFLSSGACGAFPKNKERIILSSKCAVFDSKKSIKEQEGSVLLTEY